MVRAVFVVLIIAFVAIYSQQASARDVRCPRANDAWNNCGTSCPLTCENPEPRGCNKRCNPGCQCKAGFVRRSDNACVRRNECKVTAPGGDCSRPNEIWVECGSACPRTCGNQKRPQGCPAVCRQGCECRPGFTRRARDGECVKGDGCSPVQK